VRKAQEGERRRGGKDGRTGRAVTSVLLITGNHAVLVQRNGLALVTPSLHLANSVPVCPQEREALLGAGERFAEKFPHGIFLGLQKFARCKCQRQLRSCSVCLRPADAASQVKQSLPSILPRSLRLPAASAHPQLQEAQHGAVPRPPRGLLQRYTRKQKSHLGPRGRRCEGDGGGSSLGLSEADSTHIAQRVASPMLRPRPPQHTPASAMPTGVTRTHDAAARGRRGRPWPWRRRRLRRSDPSSRSTIKRACTHDRRGRAPTTLCGAALCSPTARPGLFRRFAAPADAERGLSASRNTQGHMRGRQAPQYLGEGSPEGAAPAATARRHASTISAMAQRRSLPP
jgi:hypothetical protein